MLTSEIILYFPGEQSRSRLLLYYELHRAERHSVTYRGNVGVQITLSLLLSSAAYHTQVPRRAVPTTGKYAVSVQV